MSCGSQKVLRSPGHHLKVMQGILNLCTLYTNNSLTRWQGQQPGSVYVKLLCSRELYICRASRHTGMVESEIRQGNLRLMGKANC